MGACMSDGLPKGAQLSEAHLLGQNSSSHKAQHFTDSEQHEFQYHLESSMTHNSNLHPVFPSHQSSVASHHSSPIYGNPLATDNLKHELMTKSRDDLQRQIDILKQCSNDEIKRLKTRIHFLEDKLDQITAPHPAIPHPPGFFLSSISNKCTKGTPTKSCPNIQRIVKISQIYNKTLSSNKKHSERELLRLINSCMSTPTAINSGSIIDDYAHMLHHHCSNLFDLRMVWLDITTFLHGTCCSENYDCKSIQNITRNGMELSLVYVLDVIHCYLYHGYSDEDSATVQRLRDCIIDKNDAILEHHNLANGTMKLMVGGDGKLRHGSATSFTSNQSTVTNNTNITNISNGTRKSQRSNSSRSMSRISSLSGDDGGHRSDTDPDVVPQLPVSVGVKGKHPKMGRVHSIEMSEDRVRRLSGQVDPNHIKELIAEYDDDRKMGLEDIESDGLISPSDDASSTMDDRERAEIEHFKLKLDPKDGDDGDSENENDDALNLNEDVMNAGERKGSKHNLLRAQQGNEWDRDTMNQTVEDMKKQLFHLAVSSPNRLQ